MADLGKLAYVLVNGSRGICLKHFSNNFNMNLFSCLYVSTLIFHQPFTISLPDEQEDDFPGRVNMSFSSHQNVSNC